MVASLIQRRTLLGGALAAAALAGGRWTTATAATMDGSNPGRAIRLRPFQTYRLLVDPGQVTWFVAGYGGSPNSFALTAHYLFADAKTLDPNLELAIEFRRTGRSTEPEGGVEPGDWPGFGKLGVMPKPQDEGPGTRFWFTNTGPGRDFYVRVANYSDRQYGLAITNHAEGAALRWTAPPTPDFAPTELPEPAPAEDLG